MERDSGRARERERERERVRASEREREWRHKGDLGLEAHSWSEHRAQSGLINDIQAKSSGYNVRVFVCVCMCA